MKICIDARPISDTPHGISRYALNLITQLTRLESHHEYVLLTRPNVKHLLPPLPENFQIKECRIPNYSVREQFVVPRLLKRASVDLFHSTTYSAPVIQPCKTVVTIHDLIPLVFPHHYGWQHAVYYNQVVRRALQKAERVITVSHSSKRDLMRFFDLDQDRIVVTYNGVDDRFRPDDTRLSKNKVKGVLAIKDAYILGVANNRPYKNVVTLIRAFHKFLGMAAISYRLVVVGIGQNAKLLKDISHDTLGKSTIFLPQVTDDELIALYQKAALFVLPTLYEGFCLPVLEAMACGTPVITSNVSSLPEVTGDAAILIDPNNIDELAGAIYNVLANEALRKGLREKGIQQAKKFSWSETAKQTLKVYEEVLSER